MSTPTQSHAERLAALTEAQLDANVWAYSCAFKARSIRTIANQRKVPHICAHCGDRLIPQSRPFSRCRKCVQAAFSAQEVAAHWRVCNQADADWDATYKRHDPYSPQRPSFGSRAFRALQQQVIDKIASGEYPRERRALVTP